MLKCNMPLREKIEGNEYEVLFNLKNDRPKMALYVYNKYFPMISKKALFYKKMNSKLDIEDFLSEVYMEILHYISYIDIKKINPDTFSFWLYVSRAIYRVFYNESRNKNNQNISLDTKIEYDNGEDEFSIEPAYQENSYVEIEYSLVLAEFNSALTERQKKILLLRKKGYTIHQIKDSLSVSYGTVQRDIMLAKETFEKIFNIKGIAIQEKEKIM